MAVELHQYSRLSCIAGPIDVSSLIDSISFGPANRHCLFDRVGHLEKSKNSVISFDYIAYWL